MDGGESVKDDSDAGDPPRSHIIDQTREEAVLVGVLDDVGRAVRRGVCKHHGEVRFVTRKLGVGIVPLDVPDMLAAVLGVRGLVGMVSGTW